MRKIGTRKFSELCKKAQGIIKTVCDSENYLDYTNLFADKKFSKMNIRNKCYAMAREMGYSYPQIGKLFGKDHTTIMYSLKKYDNELKIEKERIENLKLEFLNLDMGFKYEYIPNYKLGIVEKVMIDENKYIQSKTA